MTKWIDEEFAHVTASEAVAFMVAKDDYLAMLEALKKAEEALIVAERALGDKPITRSIVTDAIKTIEDLGKE